jgi:hypothetical protein
MFPFLPGEKASILLGVFPYQFYVGVREYWTRLLSAVTHFRVKKSANSFGYRCGIFFLVRLWESMIWGVDPLKGGISLREFWL